MPDNGNYQAYSGRKVLTAREGWVPWSGKTAESWPAVGASIAAETAGSSPLRTLTMFFNCTSEAGPQHFSNWGGYSGECTIR